MPEIVCGLGVLLLIASFVRLTFYIDYRYRMASPEEPNTRGTTLTILAISVVAVSLTGLVAYALGSLVIEGYHQLPWFR